MYRLNNSKSPDIFPLFVHNYEIHNYETRQLKHFHLPPCRTNLSKMSIKYQGPIKTIANVQKCILVVIMSRPYIKNIVLYFLDFLSWL